MIERFINRFKKKKEIEPPNICPEDLNYPKEHLQLLTDMLDGKIPPVMVISYVDKDGNTQTKTIAIDKNKSEK